MSLRKHVLKLAQNHPSLREPLVRLASNAKRLASSWSKKTITVKGWSGDEHEVRADVMGSWAVHKSIGGRGWSVTFIPMGASVGSTKTGKAAKQAVEVFTGAVPGLVDAVSESQVRAYSDEIRSALTGIIPMESIMRRCGLRNLGEMAGKHGQVWGVKGGSVRIRYGARDMVLMQWQGSFQYGKIKGSWGMVPRMIFSHKNMTETMLKKWCDMVKGAPTTIELRQRLRDE